MDVLSQLSEAVGAVPARAIYMAKHFAESSLLALTLGLFGGIVGSHCFPRSLGPLVPFAGCSCVGFCLGAYSCWQSEAIRAETMLERYPILINYHLGTEFSSVLGGHPLVLKPRQPRTLADTTWLILACQTAQPNIAQVQEQQVQALIDALVAEQGEKDD